MLAVSSILLLGLLAATPRARFPEDGWTHTGPFAARVDAVVENPSDSDSLFVIADKRLYLSVDGGLTWRRSPLGQGTDDEEISAVAVDVTRPGSLFAGEAFGLFHSSGGGGHWSPPMTVPVGHAVAVVDVAISESSPQTLYVACGADAYRSDDVGETYSLLTGPWSRDFPVTAIALDPRSSEVLYAAVLGLGVYKSPDGGDHWIRGGIGLEDDELVARLVVHPVEPRFVYAVTDRARLLESSDGGVLWRSIGPPGAAIRCVAIAPDDPETILAGGDGLLRSRDHGATWSATPIVAAVSGRTVRVQSISVGPASGRIYAGTAADGLFVSGDGGATWAPRGDGLGGAAVAELVFDPASGELWANVLSDQARLFRRASGARAWSEVDLAGRAAGSALRIATGDPNTGVVYAGFKRCGLGTPRPLPCSGGLYRSVDFGASWTKTLDGAVSALATEPMDRRIVYAAVIDDDFPGGGRLWKSEDGGASFVEVAAPIDGFPPSALYPDPRVTGHLVATYGTGLFVTRDGGTSWAAAAELEMEEVTSVLQTASDSLAFAATYEGLYRSRDGGSTWEPTASNPGIGAMNYDPSDPDRLWAGTASGIARSEDDGNNWMILDPGVYSLGLRTATVEAIYVDPERRRLLVATYSGTFEHALAPVPRTAPER